MARPFEVLLAQEGSYLLKRLQDAYMDEPIGIQMPPAAFPSRVCEPLKFTPMRRLALAVYNNVKTSFLHAI